ncbi:Hypothetical predicted protein [Cloeon dipterum]|uniref:Uncharacterized protein n=1 Tax=Cloeon dipterum TaxID=197152 RepID=A0A8S1D3A0_9INSE|nr:Hypothetical predicted protein [Cloeon dipterum]
MSGQNLNYLLEYPRRYNKNGTRNVTRFAGVEWLILRPHCGERRTKAARPMGENHQEQEDENAAKVSANGVLSLRPHW